MAITVQEKLSTADYIRSLVRKHIPHYECTLIDDLADDFARLSDADVKLDDIEEKLAVLGREGILTGQEINHLFVMYRKELKNGI